MKILEHGYLIRYGGEFLYGVGSAASCGNLKPFTRSPDSHPLVKRGGKVIKVALIELEENDVVESD